MTGGAGRRGRAAAGWIVFGAAAGVGLVIALAALVGPAPYLAVGNADPGMVTRIGTPLVRMITEVAAVVCAGGLAFAVCFTAPAASGLVSPEGYLALRHAGRAAVVWFLGSVLLVPFEAASTAGQPVVDELASPANLLALVEALEAPKAWLLTAGVALVVAAGCRATLRWQPTVGLLALAAFGLLPPLATGHVSSDAGHDVATAALMVHVPAAAVWIGTLVFLIVHLWRGGRMPAAVARRYDRVASGCWVLVAASGVAAVWWLVPPGDLLTLYGAVLLGKVALLVVLGLVAVVLRRRALGGDVSGRGRLLRLAAVELALLLVTAGLSASATHLAPPALTNRAVSGQETLLGYDLAGPPTPVALLIDWRIDVFFAPLAIAFLVTYVGGVRRLRRRGEHWPVSRMVSWVAGCQLLLVATSSGIGRYAPAMFSVHIASHMLLTMLVPVLLALGGPLALAERALRRSTSGPAGPREWLEALRDSRLAALLTHPVVALVLFSGGPFALYFTSLFDAAMRYHWAHQVINACFLVIGYAFAWAVIGVDRLPRPMPNLARVGVLLAAMPAEAVFAAAIMNTGRVIGDGDAGGNMLTALALPWVPDLLADQWWAGLIGLLIGEVSLFVALAALVLRWSQVDDDPGSGLGDHVALRAVSHHHR